MTHISKRKLDKSKELKLIKNFELVFSKVSKEDDMHDLLGSLLTQTERVMLAKRLGIVILLKENVSQDSIASALNVTQATVSRMQLFLETRGKGYEIALSTLSKIKTYKIFKNFLLKLAGYSIRAAGGYVKPTVV